MTSSAALFLEENVFPKVWGEEEGNFASAFRRDLCLGHPAPAATPGWETAWAQEYLESRGSNTGNIGTSYPKSHRENPRHWHHPAMIQPCPERQHPAPAPSRVTEERGRYLGVAEPGEPTRKLPALEVGQHCPPASSKLSSSLGMLLCCFCVGPASLSGDTAQPWGHCRALGTLQSLGDTVLTQGHCRAPSRAPPPWDRGSAHLGSPQSCQPQTLLPAVSPVSPLPVSCGYKTFPFHPQLPPVAPSSPLQISTTVTPLAGMHRSSWIWGQTSPAPYVPQPGQHIWGEGGG